MLVASRRLLAGCSALVALGACATAQAPAVSSPPDTSEGGSPVDAAADAIGAGDGAGAPEAAPPGEAGAIDAGGSDASDAAAAEASAPDGGDAAVANARADDAVAAMLLGFWSPGQRYLRATAGGATATTGYWTFAQAWDAVLDAVERHGPASARFAGTLTTFYDAQGAAGWSSAFYDDENWMTLALLRAYDLTGDAAYLTQAKALYADIMAAWDTSCCGAAPGGIWWDRSHTQKATASNAGPVIAGARLYTRTHDASTLAFAKQAYAYWTANMVDPASHQVIDHITPAGQKVGWKFTYNEGLVIGAAVALANATGDPSTLALAHDVASFMLASETVPTALGPVLSDGSDAQCTGDCAQFKGIGARYLAELYSVGPSHAEYRALLEQSAGGAWTLARDPSTRLYGSDWAAPFAPPAELNATSSAAMALSAAAALEGPPPADPPLTFEAEESVLHGVGLEAAYAGFLGWGYVAGWNADGQWVDFTFDVPAAGQYDLAFRYAGGAGSASRLIYVNGANAVANQIFSGTGAWNAYATQVVTVTLHAGVNTVSVIYNGSLGSSGYLNLDRLSVGAH
jgi:predicted alpha-1,6-mannanase (GH76 family)